MYELRGATHQLHYVYALHMLTFLLIVVLLVIVVLGYMQHPRFGGKPAGDSLRRIQSSPNYREGRFQNLEFTPDLTEGYAMPELLYRFLFKKVANKKPSSPLPSVNTDLPALPQEKDVLVWFGHSSYYLQLNGVRFLIDPVFTNNASPIYGTTRAFAGTNVYGADDLPTVDYLVITHDHYDHLDYGTIKSIKAKVQQVICGLGVGAHFRRWGFSTLNITELDWNESTQLKNNITAHALPARHFSGRSFKRNTSLWMALMLQTGGFKVLLGGDSGYGQHFKAIGDAHGPIDLAIIENGQYNEAWEAIHCLPHQTVQAAKDLQAKSLMPVHNSKFALAMHAWTDPMQLVTEANREQGVHLVRPRIGEVVDLHDRHKLYPAWWEV